jgi:SagB-type dehydrogenase family enzyme
VTSLRPSEPWYVGQGRRGQELLEQGRISEATRVFEAVLAGLGGEVSYGRAVVLERLGRALLLAGVPERALRRLREALELAGRLAPTDAVRRLRCTLRSGLGDALQSSGRVEEARRAYLAALEIGLELRDPRSQGVDQARLGALALAQGDTAEALERYRSSLEALRQLKEPALEAVAWDELGRLYGQLGDPSEAARHLREAVECERRSGPSLRLAGRLIALAERLRAQPQGWEEARQVAGQALAVAQGAEPTAAEAWAAYGVLGEIHQDRNDLRELGRRAPLIVAAAERVGQAPTLGRAVLLGRLGRCFDLGGRRDLAAAYLTEAVRVAEQVRDTDGAADLLGMLWTELGDILRTLGNVEQAAAAFAASLRIAESSEDLEGQARNRQRLGQPHVVSSVIPAEQATGLSILEEVVTRYGFDPNLLVDGPRTRRLVRCADEPPAVPDEIRPLLVPCTRTWLDPEGRIRLVPPAEEPRVQVAGECTVMRSVSRDVAVSGELEPVWRLLGAMDGRSSWSEIRSQLPEGDRATAARILAALAAAGVVDVSGRPLGRFIHWCTKKGVIPAGGLEGDEVLRLAAEAEPRTGGELQRIPLGTDVPERLRTFQALTQSRRSTRDYWGGALSRQELDALLLTACGVTGSIRWTGGEMKLRAYPSSGALYSVGVYPVVVRVEGMEPAVHRFDPNGPALEVIGAPLDPKQLVHAALPMEREMLAGIAMMVCLTGVFPRHERKYGEGGYRMMVAEAGHISHNLVLAATALGLSARPFGGVFDRLINEMLRLEETREEFLLAVVVGR